MNAPLVERCSCAANRPATRVMVLVADGVSQKTVSATLLPFLLTNPAEAEQIQPSVSWSTETSAHHADRNILNQWPSA